MRPFIRQAIGTILAICLATAAQAQTIRFGAILPLSGADAAIGQEQLRGIQFAVDQANAAGGIGGHPVELRFADNQTQPDRSVAIFNTMAAAQGKIPLIFTAGPGLAALAPLATREKIILLNATKQNDTLSGAAPFLVSTVPTNAQETQVLAQYLISQGKTRGAILFEDTPAGAAARDDFAKYFPEAGGTILAQEPTRSGQADYRPALLKLADARPDVALVFLATGLRAMAQQYKRLGLAFTVAATTPFNEPETIADPAVEGFVHTHIETNVPLELVADFREKFGLDMGMPARLYYSATQVILTMAGRLQAEEKPLTGEAMRDMIFAIGNDSALRIDVRIVNAGQDSTVGKQQSN